MDSTPLSDALLRRRVSDQFAFGAKENALEHFLDLYSTAPAYTFKMGKPRVQVYESGTGGHFTTYIQFLMPKLIDLLNEGVISEIILTVSDKHLKSPSFQQQLEVFKGRVSLDLIPAPTASSKVGRIFEDANQLLASSWRNRADFLISTTANPPNELLALRNFIGLSSFPPGLRSTGLFHAGYGLSARNWRHRMNNLLHRWMWDHSPFDRKLFVNPLVYEWERARAGISGICPDPIECSHPVEKVVARQLLGLPTDGRYIGIVGSTSSRIPLKELLLGFQNALTRSNDRFLIMGTLLEDHRSLITAHFSELISNSKLILIDKFFEFSEFLTGFSALDVAAVIYSDTPALSNLANKALAAHRPILVNDFGYTGMLVRNFSVGWACNPMNPKELSKTIEISLDESKSYVMNERASRLVQFLSPENYANTVLSDLLQQVAGEPRTAIKTWEWVMGSSSGFSSVPLAP